MRTSSDHEVGLVARPATATSGVGVADAGDHVLARIDQQAGDALAQQHRVLGDHDAHGSTARRIVGPPAGLSRWMEPPSDGDALAQAGEAGAVGPSPAPPAPLSRDLDHERVARAHQRHRGVGGAGVLGHVGERLGHHEVGGALDLGATAVGLTSTSSETGIGARATTADSAASRPRSSRITGWMPRTRSRSSCSAALASSCAWHDAPVDRFLVLVVEVLPRRAQLHGQADQALLRAVVQVALDAPALGLGAPDGRHPPALRGPYPGFLQRALVGTEEPRAGRPR